MSTLKANQLHLISDLDIASATLRTIEKIETFITKTTQTLRLWASRTRDRKQLAHMSDRMLRDIGLNRADIDYELNKFFWQK